MKEFSQVFEAAMTKYNSNGFAVGNVVKFRSGFKSAPCFKDLPKEGQKMLEQFEKQWSKHTCRVVNLNGHNTTSANPARDTAEPAHMVQISAELCPGMFCGYAVTVPCDCLEIIDYGINLAPLPDHLIAKNNSTSKPEPVGKIEYEMKPQEIVDTDEVIKEKGKKKTKKAA